MKIGQSSVEFLILTGAAILVFLIFSVVIQSNIKDKTIEQTDFKMREIGFLIREEVNLAIGASDGYWREFSVPEKISNRPYSVNISDGLIYLKTDDEKFATSIPVGNVIGALTKGKNFITKYEGQVYLNLYP